MRFDSERSRSISSSMWMRSPSLVTRSICSAGMAILFALGCELGAHLRQNRVAFANGECAGVRAGASLNWQQAWASVGFCADNVPGVTLDHQHSNSGLAFGTDNVLVLKWGHYYYNATAITRQREWLAGFQCGSCNKCVEVKLFFLRHVISGFVVAIAFPPNDEIGRAHV